MADPVERNIVVGEGEILVPADLLREVIEVLPVPDSTCQCRKCRVGRRVRAYLLGDDADQLRSVV